MIALALVCAAVAPAAAIEPPPSEPREAHDNSSRRRFAPGVWIDWRQATVELDATIVLREGPLELVACSPRTREHESIFVVTARPMHIFQALGLVGLDAGSPLGYDEEHERWIEPTGEELEIRVRYRHADAERIATVRDWLLDVKSGKPPVDLKWVLTGSRTLEGGRFAADLDGTVICVVDFDSALIAPSSLHTADNELLWLRANADEIPPVKTACTLLIRSAQQAGIVVTLTPAGGLLHDGRTITQDELVTLVRAEKADQRARRVVLRVASNVPKARIEAVVAALVKAGVERDMIRIVPRKATESIRPRDPDRDTDKLGSGVEVP